MDHPSLDELRAVIAALPALQLPVAAATSDLGRLAALGRWLAGCQGRRPSIRRARLAVFLGSHGCAPDSAAATRALLDGYVAGQGALHGVCEAVDLDLRVYELDLDNPTADLRACDAMTDEDCARAVAYGMMAVETGVDALGLVALGAGGHTAAAAMLQAVEAGLDGLEALRSRGGYEIAAALGALVAARRADVPVVIDGVGAAAALTALGDTPSARPATEIVDLGIGREDGTAAALAIGVLKTAAAAYAP